MRGNFVFKKRNAVADHGVSDNGGRVAVLQRHRLVVSCGDLFQVVSVDLNDIPMKAFQLVCDRFDLAAFLDAGIALDAVDIEKRDQVVEAMSAGVHDGFPHAAFLQLAIAVMRHDPMFLAPDLGRHG